MSMEVIRTLMVSRMMAAITGVATAATMVGTLSLSPAPYNNIMEIIRHQY